MNLNLETSLKRRVWRTNLLRTHRLFHLHSIQNEVLYLQVVHDLFKTLRPRHSCSI